ncbi:MAG: hypothetical protein QM765_43440 [Myxococcales bacterium]
MTRLLRTATLTLLAGLSLAAGDARATEPGSSKEPKAVRAEVRASVPPAGPNGWRVRRGQYFQRNWGIDVVGVRRVSSGMMLRFDYRVVDPDKAKVLTERKARPYLVDEASRTALAVPAMENIGELRQVAPLEAGRTYFMIFGNPGGLVKAGGKVSLVVGGFRADGLEVR